MPSTVLITGVVIDHPETVEIVSAGPAPPSVARAFLERGAGAFVGALWSVGDAPVRVFTEALYDSLLAGRRMAEAVRAARSAAKDARDAAWLSYAVYAHPNAILKEMDA